MSLTYEYKLLLVVNPDNLKALQHYRATAQPENVEFSSVQGFENVTFSPVAGGNVTFSQTEGMPDEARKPLTFFQVPGNANVKKDSNLEILAISLAKGITGEQATDAIESGALKMYTDNCVHYALYAIVKGA
jgi:hypothetical protein